MSRKHAVNNHALALIAAFTEHQGLRLFYQLKGITVQNFPEYEWNYFNWLLSAIPAAYQGDVKKRIAELDLELSDHMKTRLGIQQNRIPFSVVHNTKKIPMEKVVPPESNMEIVSEILLEQDGVGPSRSELDMDERRRT